MAGYSENLLARKLGIKPHSELVVINGPAGYERLVAPLPEGVRIAPRVTRNTHVVHVFAAGRAHLARHLEACLKRMADDSVVWVSWPKRSSGVDSEITDAVIRELALPLGLVDVKVCAVDEVWSGLKLVIRKERRNTGREVGRRRR